MERSLDRFDLVQPRGATRLVYGEGAIASAAEELAPRLAGGPLFVVTAEPILARHAEALAPLERRAGSATRLVVPDGEAAKCPAEAERLWRDLLAGGCRRDSIVAGFGGGSVTDLAGFVAATFARGVDWIALPTTLLAQVDAAVGGKTAIDLPAAKNAVGAFHHPVAVVAESGVLATLDAAQRRHGLVEAIKTAAIADAALFDRIEASLEGLLAGDPERLAPVTAATARAKARLVARDPDESGPRQLLNFGHTLGHALESEIGHGRIAHGDAVAHGLRFALRLSLAAGCDGAFAGRVESLLERLGAPPLPTLEPEALLGRTSSDKKARAGGLGWVLLTGPGEGRFGVPLPAAAVAEALSEFLSGAADRPL